MRLEPFQQRTMMPRGEAGEPHARKGTKMAEKVRGNAVIGQSGGPTAVINQSLVGVILEERKHKIRRHESP